MHKRGGKMPITQPEKQANYRKRQRMRGKKSVLLTLDIDSHARLIELQKALKGISLSEVIEVVLKKEMPDLPAQFDSIQARAKVERRKYVIDQIGELRSQGLTFQAIADRLNRDGVQTLSGKGSWNKRTVQRLA